MHLISLELGFFQFAGNENGCALRIDFHRVPKGGALRHSEDLLEHLNDVVVGVILVVEQDHVIERLDPAGGIVFDFGKRCS